jgi:hypothetical protein
MTDSTPTTPDPDNSATDITVGGSIEVDAQGQVAAADSGETPTETDNRINPATGQPYPPMGVPLNDQSDGPNDVEMSDNPDDVTGDRVYMSLAWHNVSKAEAQRIKDAALAVADPMSSYSVDFSDPVT